MLQSQVARSVARVGRFPLAVSSNSRYLVDASGVPFFVHGDVGWSITHNLTLSEAMDYLDDRVARGFNSLIILAPCAYSQTGDYPDNVEGAATVDRQGYKPFSPDTDITAPVEAYWAHVDDVIAAATARDFALFDSFAYLGFSDNEGIRAWLDDAGTSGCREYGQFIGARYGRYANILFTLGGDTNPTSYADYLDEIRLGILDEAPDALFLTHWNSDGHPYDYLTDFPLASFDLFATYDYGDIGAAVYDEYTYSTTKPVLLFESDYQDGWGGQTAADVRKYPYRAVLSGALCGHFYGSESLWSFNNAGDPDLWRTKLNSTGAQYMAHVPQLFRRYAWYTLVPSRDDTLMTSGHGDPDTDAGCQGAVNAAGTLAMIFFPSNLTVTVSLAKLNGGSTVTGKWFNPATGAWTTIGSWAAPGRRDFTPPTASDYVLVLTSA